MSFTLFRNSQVDDRARKDTATLGLRFQFARLGQQLPTKERLMSAILLTPGPTCSYHSFTQSGPPSFRSISKQEYGLATSKLEENNLGIQVAVKVGYVTKLVFVKHSPEVIGPILQRSPDLYMWCTPQEFAARYQCKLSVKINQNIRNQLMEKGYVTEEQMRWL